MEQIGLISTLALMPATPSEAHSFALGFLSELEQGNINPLEWAKKIKEIKKAIELIEKGTGGLNGLTEIALKHASNKIDEVEIKHVVKYDYSQCCDFEWDFYETKINEFRGYQKEREAKLRTVRGSETIEYVNPQGGEVGYNKVFEPKKKITDYLSFKK